MTPQEHARICITNLRDDLVSQGWTLTRDNEAGGALVVEGDGIRLVIGVHGYEVKDLPPDPEPERLEPSPGNDAEPEGAAE